VDIETSKARKKKDYADDKLGEITVCKKGHDRSTISGAMKDLMNVVSGTKGLVDDLVSSVFVELDGPTCKEQSTMVPAQSTLVMVEFIQAITSFLRDSNNRLDNVVCMLSATLDGQKLLSSSSREEIDD